MKNLFLISILFCSCNMGKGVQEDTKKNILSHKAFMRTLSFSGEVGEKIFCENCHLNKYQIIINLKEINYKDITLSNKSFQPYYFFNENNRLNISVAKDFYEFAQKGLSIHKEESSDDLIVGTQKYRLISNEAYKWLPD